MRLPISRIHFYEIDDQSWFPSFFRSRIQASLTHLWTSHLYPLQPVSPADLAVSVLKSHLGSRISDFAYVDFCAGAGGPTPHLEAKLNADLDGKSTSRSDGKRSKGKESAYRNGTTHKRELVDFVLTDIHPHIPAWQAACAQSPNLHYVSSSVDAGNAPQNILELAGIPTSQAQDKKIFRLFSLAFHHLDDDTAAKVLENTLATSSGFAILELQDRTVESILTILSIGPLMWLGSWYWFWGDWTHLFWTYIIPVLPFVLVFDGLVSSLRTRNEMEIFRLMKGKVEGTDGKGWRFESGKRQHTVGIGEMGYFIGVKEE